MTSTRPPLRPVRNPVIHDGMVVRAVNSRSRVGFAKSPDRLRWHLGSGSALPTVIAIVVVAIAVAIAVTVLVVRAQSVTIEISGLAEGDTRHADEYASNPVFFDVEGGEVDRAVVTLDGRERNDVLISGDRITWIGDGLFDGQHELTVDVPRRLWGRTSETVTFTVDSEPPVLDVPDPTPTPIDEPAVLTGRVEPGTRLALDGDPVDLGPDGSFELRWDEPPMRPFELVATDRAGNETVLETAVPIAYPETRAIHVSSAAWADPGLKADVMELIDAGLVNAVELSLKDEAGEIGFDSESEIGHRIGSVRPLYALRDAIAELHDAGVRVIGRIVAFRDPVLVDWAWANDERDWVIQTADGEAPFRRREGFANYANPEVRRYNLELAREAASMGIDEILWDYIRRPAGAPESMIVPNRGETSSSEHVWRFLEEGRALLRPFGVYQGASVFGIAATRPDQIAQDIPMMASHADYISPMLYPALWNEDEYGVADPEAQPGDIIRESLADFQDAVDGKGAALVPWLQDFSLRLDYGEAEVRAQIDAATEHGAAGFLLWDPHVTYTSKALE